ncbi:hypothetical protein AK830_g1310 [Neonectria ditissima]|uniref:Uncharacterized protein n=1 Tax=Neonectria ditissima TaxID=78410 RepID=A0A0P7B647_9HYPO|nr:hypothetical protein AK830_g1310 [Neonectria ditissima]
MKLQLFMLSLTAMTALAAPVLEGRQNDIPPCEDGGEGPVNDAFDTSAECKEKCFLRENADNDNKYGVCAGACRNVGHPAPIFQCRGDAT